MVNRVVNTLEEIRELRAMVNAISKPSSKTILIGRLKALEWRLGNFGKRYKIVKALCSYRDPKGEDKIEDFYFTDIEEFEAIDLLKFQVLGTIHNITTMVIPVGIGQPIGK